MCSMHVSHVICVLHGYIVCTSYWYGLRLALSRYSLAAFSARHRCITRVAFILFEFTYQMQRIKHETGEPHRGSRPWRQRPCGRRSGAGGCRYERCRVSPYLPLARPFHTPPPPPPPPPPPSTPPPPPPSPSTTPPLPPPPPCYELSPPGVAFGLLAASAASWLAVQRWQKRNPEGKEV